MMETGSWSFRKTAYENFQWWSWVRCLAWLMCALGGHPEKEPQRSPADTGSLCRQPSQRQGLCLECVSLTVVSALGPAASSPMETPSFPYGWSQTTWNHPDSWQGFRKGSSSAILLTQSLQEALRTPTFMVCVCAWHSETEYAGLQCQISNTWKTISKCQYNIMSTDSGGGLAGPNFSHQCDW